MQSVDSSKRAVLTRLWRHISYRRRVQFVLLLMLMILTSFFEIFSIGALLPFLSALISPDRIFENPRAQIFVNALNLNSPGEILFPLTVLFVTLSLLATGMRLLMVWANTRVTFATGADLSIRIYRNTLYQPYETHISRNSSIVINGITSKSNSLIYQAILPALTIISSGFMLLVIIAALIAVDPVVALLAFGGFATIYACVIALVKNRLNADSGLIARESTHIIKALQEGLGGIRDVLIDGSQEQYCQSYRNADVPLRRAQGNNIVIAHAPRLLVEGLGMVLIASLAYWLAIQPSDGIVSAIPTLGVLALGAQRMLPMLQQSYSSWVSLHGAKSSIADAIDLLDQPLPLYAGKELSKPMPFERSICLKNIDFRYKENSVWVLKGVSLQLKKGERVGFIGSTGSGKSTLLDVVMGLLTPANGVLEIDGREVNSTNCREWQANISHVPQTIFLADCSVEENIAFGLPKSEIDHQRVRYAAQRAQIANVIETMHQGYETPVGERGVKLSGGQRQRLGIARALYKQASVMVFDEATSALDNETESSVMDAIESISPDVTILMIAHRLTTLRQCTRIVELDQGRICRSGTYAEIIANRLKYNQAERQ